MREAAMTRRQLLQLAEQLPEDRSAAIHQFPDGWSVRALTTYGDLHREGELMGNCWSHEHENYHPIWDRVLPDDKWMGELSPDQVQEIYGRHLDYREGESEFMSLRDPDNIPHVSFTHDDVTQLGDPLGRHNSDPKPEYWRRLDQFVNRTARTANDGVNDPLGENATHDPMPSWEWQQGGYKKVRCRNCKDGCPRCIDWKRQAEPQSETFLENVPHDWFDAPKGAV